MKINGGGQLPACVNKIKKIKRPSLSMGPAKPTAKRGGWAHRAPLEERLCHKRIPSPAASSHWISPTAAASSRLAAGVPLQRQRLCEVR